MLAIGISYGHWCGGRDPASQTFLYRCEQSERRYRKRRGGGWDPRPFRIVRIQLHVGFGLMVGRQR